MDTEGGDVDFLVMDSSKQSIKVLTRMLFPADTFICLKNEVSISVFLNAGPGSKSLIMQSDYEIESDLSSIERREECIFFCVGTQKFTIVSRTEKSDLFFYLIKQIEYEKRVVALTEKFARIENKQMSDESKAYYSVCKEKQSLITSLLKMKVDSHGQHYRSVYKCKQALIPIVPIWTTGTIATILGITPDIPWLRSCAYELETGGSATREPISEPLSLPKNPEYADERTRIETYQHWLYEKVQDPKQLARVGFFYTKMLDLVRCFFCGLGLKDFSNTDDPLLEHVRYSETCGFLIHTEGKAKINDIKAMLVQTDPEFCRRQQWQDIQRRCTGDVVRCFACDGGLQKWDPTDDPWIEHCRWFPACPFVLSEKGEEYIRLVQQAVETGDETRLEAAIAQPSQDELVTGMERLDVGATGSQTKSHRAMMRKLEKMGFREELIQSALTRLEHNQNQNLDIHRVLEEIENIQKSSEYSTCSRRRRLIGLREEHERLKNMRKCERCKVADRAALFLPCKHLRMCMACSEDVYRCPLCNEDIQHKIKTYIA